MNIESHLQDLIVSRRWMGSSVDLHSLLSTIDDEVYWNIFKDEYGNETYPYVLVVEITPGEIAADDLFAVVRQSFYSVQLVVLRDEKAYKAFERSMDKLDERTRRIPPKQN